MRTYLHIPLSVIGATALVASSLVWVSAQQRPAPPAPIDADDIGGVVTSAKGPEAGVWVIAETTELPTKFARIVVTDDRGRYVVPDLPRASYQVFVRGYGLLDSTRQTAKPGQQLNLTALVAPDARAAAQVYPAAWWLSMVPLPDDREAQKKFTMDMKECYDCHQVGNKATREMSPAMSAGTSSLLEAWERRTKVGPSGPQMGTTFMAIGDHRKAFADWTDRIARGEAPKAAPPRPAGVERNIVITEWDWGTPTDGRSDNAASDTRNARVNANGPIYGASEMTDTLSILDPAEHTSTVVKIVPGAPNMVSAFNASPTPSPTWGPDVWKRSADPRSIAIDGQARVWLAVRSREAQKQPAFCGEGSSNTFARYYPLRQSGRQVALFDPKTKQFSFFDTCFSADHNMISPDNKIYFGQTGAIGWVDITAWDKTHDAEASQGWCPAVLDTNGDGQISEWTEPNAPVDPAKDHRINFGCYSIAVNPKDGSLWCSGIGRGDKRLMRMEKGSNPPQILPIRVLRASIRRVDRRERLGRPRNRHQRRRLAELARERTLLGVRSHEVQVNARPERDGAELPGRLDVLSQERSDLHQQRLPRERELPHAHGRARRARPRQGRADVRVGEHRRDRSAEPEDEAVRHAARAVSDGILPAIRERTHRQPERWLERQGTLGRLRELRGVAHRGRARNVT